MCGRYSFTKEERDDISEQEINELMKELENKYPAYKVPDEVFPATYAPVMISKPNNEMELVLMKWGFRERLKEYQDGHFLREFEKDIFNTRIESVKKIPYWFDAIKNKRCLVPANRWFEWNSDGAGKNKIKYALGLKEKSIFYFAGLWRETVDQSTGELIQEFSIIMTDANDLVRQVHTKGRMPSILDNKYESLTWLNHSNSLDSVINIAQKTYPQELMWVKVSA